MHVTVTIVIVPKWSHKAIWIDHRPRNKTRDFESMSELRPEEYITSN